MKEPSEDLTTVGPSAVNEVLRAILKEREL